MAAPAPIDRQALVSRHNVVLTHFNGDTPLQVGNGELAFGMDITGLQTFVPFNTMSQWGWHKSPLPKGQKVSDFRGQVWETYGRPVRYMMDDPGRPELSTWMATNPHRINLGRIGLNLLHRDGSPAEVSDLLNARQKLDLWQGIVTSEFEFDGEPVKVVTACHPRLDAVAVKIVSPLVRENRLSVYVACPGDDNRQFANFVGDWSHPSDLIPEPNRHNNQAHFSRRLDGQSYFVGLAWSGKADIARVEAHAPTLSILKAEYGAAGHWIDVMEKAKALVRDGQLTMHADNSLGEPIHGVKKDLRITYRLHGKTLVASAPENEDVRIDTYPERHRVTLKAGTGEDELSAVCAFSEDPLNEVVPSAEATFSACRKAWQTYWRAGGAIDFSGSKDPRANELERRIVLSQYLMKVNEAGTVPPQESGLVNNGWFGKFHLEMVWWHEAHWALWNHWPELDRSIGFYQLLLNLAEKRATDQGFRGARWPKAIGPEGEEWPHIIHGTLIWQQPHPIFFAELDYRAHPTHETLEKWAPVVEATADFMASYAFFNREKKRYVLGPPLTVVSENTDARTTQNPTFELGYWRFGLRTAQLWRTRMGLAPRRDWDKVLHGLSPLPEQAGLYVLHEGVKDMWTKFNFEHPAISGAYGLLPGDGVDTETMKRTLDKIFSTWDFNHTWGWDFPMLAMCAARLGEPQRAVDLLLTESPGFQFEEHGLATGGPFPYFPANGGLLYAVAMMAAGWEGAPNHHAPGFPVGSGWKLRWEGLSPAP